MPSPESYVVIGAPASGKSSVARALAAGAAAGLHIPVDDLRHLVVGGLVEPSDAEWGPALVVQISLARRSALDIADRYSEPGFTTLIDDFLDPLLVREYDQVLDRAVCVCRVPSLDAALARNRARGGPPELLAYLEGGIRLLCELVEQHADASAARGWHLLDNTDLDIEETAAIMRSLADHRDPGTEEPAAAG